VADDVQLNFTQPKKCTMSPSGDASGSGAFRVEIYVGELLEERGLFTIYTVMFTDFIFTS
jgi:hypothetical protein